MNNTVSFDEGLSSSSSILSMANHDFHVLLVEHDSKDLDNAKQMLEYFSYKVTAVKLASTALTILSKGNQLDVVITNSSSPDSYSFKLVQEASKMGILVILMSEEDNIATTMRALEEGAFLCIKKPIQVHTVMYLWQHVLREKTRSLYREIERIVEDPLTDCSDFDDVQRPTKRNANGIHIASEEDASRNGNYPNNNDVTYQKKVWIEWTQELHDKFVAAIRILGEGRCYPKDILELMNVPGLTRMQVASHLQKCRGGKWQPPNERKSKTSSNSNNNQEITRPSKNIKPRRAQPMRFGSMPFPHETPSMQLGIGDPNNYHHQDFATIQKTGHHQTCVLETGVYNSSANTDRQVYRHPQFAADLSQDHYSHFTASNGSKETFNLGQQLCSNNVSKEVPFFDHQVFDLFQSGVRRSANCSNQRNNVDNAEGAFRYAGLKTAQNFSFLQQEFGVIMNNNSSGISMQQPFGGYYDQNQTPADVATDGSTDEDFDSLLREED